MKLFDVCFIISCFKACIRDGTTYQLNNSNHSANLTKYYKLYMILMGYIFKQNVSVAGAEI